MEFSSSLHSQSPVKLNDNAQRKAPSKSRPEAAPVNSQQQLNQTHSNSFLQRVYGIINTALTYLTDCFNRAKNFIGTQFQALKDKISPRTDSQKMADELETDYESFGSSYNSYSLQLSRAFKAAYHLKSLHLRGPVTAKDFIQLNQACPNIQRLVIENNDELLSAQTLVIFKNLKQLYVTDCNKFAELKHLGHLPNLRGLALTRCSAAELLLEINEIRKLSTLIINEMPKFDDLSINAIEPSVRKLILSKVNLTDTGLKRMPNFIEILEVHETPNITDKGIDYLELMFNYRSRKFINSSKTLTNEAILKALKNS